MCDIIAGQLLVCFAAEDVTEHLFLEQAKGGYFTKMGMSYLESMKHKLARLQLRQHPHIQHSLHLVKVRAGEENHWATLLYAWHADQAMRTPSLWQTGDLTTSFVVAPNYMAQIAGTTGSSVAVSGQGFTFGPKYSMYQSMTGLTGKGLSKAIRVLVVDTGLAADAIVPVHSQKNILDPSQNSVSDDNGHGTAIALLIDNLAPGTEFIIFKAGNAKGEVNEWDLLAALLADAGAHVISLSLEYGLGDRICGTCGRQSATSRSAVFENIINATAKWAQRPMVVAVAGNGKAPELAYPARFGDVVAVGSVNSSKGLSNESNYGSTDHAGNPHLNHFTAPGGDSDPQNPEFIIELSNGKRYRGTSFSAAFATAAVVVTIDACAPGCSQSSVLNSLRHNADRTFPSYTNPHHGNGITRV